MYLFKCYLQIWTYVVGLYNAAFEKQLFQLFHSFFLYGADAIYFVSLSINYMVKHSFQSITYYLFLHVFTVHK